MVADRYHHASGDVARDGAAQDNGGERKRPMVIADGPRDAAQRDLEQRVAVEERLDDDHEDDGEGIVRCCFVWLVERV